MYSRVDVCTMPSYLCTSNLHDWCGKCRDCANLMKVRYTHCAMCNEPVNHATMAYEQFSTDRADKVGRLRCYPCAETVPSIAPLDDIVHVYTQGNQSMYIRIDWDTVYRERLLEYKEGMPIRFTKAIEMGVPWAEMCRWWRN